MNNQQQNNDNQEIDLTLLTKKIGGVFSKLNRFVFNCIQFVIKRKATFLTLFFIGFGIGLYLDTTQKTYTTEIIVAPNFGSTDYMYAKIKLLDSKIKEKDTIFLKSVGIKNPEKLLKIEVAPIVDVYNFVGKSESNFELIKLIAEEGDIKKIIEDKTTSKNYGLHTITLTTKNATQTTETGQPILDYLNASDYFKVLQNVFVENIKTKIASNEIMLSQIDGILNEFSTATAANNQKSDKLVYYNENSQLNDILKSKDELIKEQGIKKLELINFDKTIKDVSITKNIKNEESINGHLKFVLPLFFIVTFLVIHFFFAFYKQQQLLANE